MLRTSKTERARTRRRRQRQPTRHGTATARMNTRRKLLLEALEPRMLLTVDPQIMLDVNPATPQLDASADVLIGEDATIAVTFDNDAMNFPVADELGYGPYLDVVIDYGGNDGVFPFDFAPSVATKVLDPPLFPLSTNSDPTKFEDEPDGLGVDVAGQPVADLIKASVAGQALLPHPDPSVADLIFTPMTAACVAHPFAVNGSGSPLSVCGTPGDLLVTARLPFGSFADDQSPVPVMFSLHVSSLADEDEELYVYARGGFEFGDNENGIGGTIVGPDVNQTPAFNGTVTNWSRGDLVPQVLTVSKTNSAHEGETATGPNFERRWQVTVDIATGQTIDALTLQDLLPTNVQYLGNLNVQYVDLSGNYQTASVTHVAGSPPPTSTPLNATNNLLALQPNAGVTGVAGFNDEVTMSFSFFVPETDVFSTPLIPPLTGLPPNMSVNAVVVEGTWQPIDTRDGPTVTVDNEDADKLLGKSIAIQKEVSVNGSPARLAPNGNPIGVRPGDTIEYYLNFQVSDYFGFEAIKLSDYFSDGQEFVDAELQVEINNLPSGFAPISPSSISSQFVLQHSQSDRGVQCPANVSTPWEKRVEFDISAELLSRGIGPGGGALYGGRFPTPSGNGPTTATLKFTTQVLNAYDTFNDSGDPPLNEHDELGNCVFVEGVVLDGSNPSAVVATANVAGDESQAYLAVPVGGFDKKVEFVNGVAPVNSPPFVAPGDMVTFLLRKEVPVGNAENLTIRDFLPHPKFLATGPVTSNVTSSIPGLLVSGPIPDPASNSLTWTFPTFSTNTPGFIEIRFTVPATAFPYADGLSLTNDSDARQQDTHQHLVGLRDFEPIISSQPELNITKGVIAAANPKAEFAPQLPGPVSFTPAGSTGVRWADSPADGGTVVINSTNLGLSPINSNLQGVDAGDLVTFAIVVENTGSSHYGAFDIRVKDTLPSGFANPSGDLNLNITDGRGNSFLPGDVVFLGPSFNEMDLFGQGIELLDPGTTLSQPGGTDSGALDEFDPLDGENIVIITYDLRVSPLVELGDMALNTATLVNYAAGEGGDDRTDPDDLNDPADDAKVTIGPAALEKSIIVTSEPSTTGNHVTIGEIVRYRLQIQMPEAVGRDFTVRDVLPAGLQFLNDDTAKIGFVSNSGGMASINPDLAGTDLQGDPINLTGNELSVHSPVTIPMFDIPASVISGGPFTAGVAPVFSLGDVINVDRDDDCEYIVIEFNALVTNTLDTNDWETKTNRFTLQSGTAAKGITTQVSNDAPVIIVEPKLTVTKEVVDITGTSATFKVVVTNTESQASAFDVRISDAPMPLLDVTFSNLLVQTNVVVSGLTVTTGPSFVDVQAPELIGGASITLTYRADFEICDDVHNAAEVTWTSLPGASGTFPNPTGSQTPGAPREADGERIGVVPVDPPDPSDPPNPPNDYLAVAEQWLGSIGNLVWHDVDGDGERDAGEPGMPWVRVDLVWPGMDRLLGTSDDKTFSTMTDADGFYHFCGLPAGDYRVTVDRESLDPRKTPTFDLDGGDDATTLVALSHDDLMAPTVGRDDVDFGFAVPGSIHGFKYEDLNFNGQYDLDEPPMEGVEIVLAGLDGKGNPVAPITVTTDANGEYWFMNLMPGAYTVDENVTGMKPTTMLPITIELASKQSYVASPSPTQFSTDGLLVLTGTSPITTFQQMIVGTDGQSPIIITEANNNVLINGTQFGRAGMALTLTEFAIKGSRGADLIDLSGVTTTSFPALTSVSIEAGGGDDRIIGSEFYDIIHGGSGDDEIDGGAGDDAISGDDGNDTICAGDGNDDIQGGDGDDRICAGPGDDIVFGESGNDRISGGAGNDRLFGGDGDDGLAGNQGSDTIHGDDGNDIVLGDEGDDFLFGDAGDDVVLGEAGVDEVDGGAGVDLVAGGGNGIASQPGDVVVGETIDDNYLAVAPWAHCFKIETIVEPKLAIGNVLDGSIHGLKFEDLNFDGVRNEGEPPLENVEIVLSWTDPDTGRMLEETTTTMANGEFWFEHLTPGITYSVAEILPAGSMQTTAPIPTLFVGSGQAYVATAEQGEALSLLPQFTGSQQTASFYTSLGGSFPVIQQPVITDLVVDVSLDEVAPAITFNSQELTFDAFTVVVDRSFRVPDTFNTLLEITTRLNFDPIVISTNNLGPLDLIPGSGPVLEIEHFGEPRVGVITGTYEVVGPTETFSGSFSSELSETGFSSGGRLSVANFPDAVSLFMDSSSRLVATDPVVFSGNVDGIPIDVELGRIDVNAESIVLASQPSPDANRPIRPVVDPTLAIGNVFPASIHGMKCEDTDADGRPDPANRTHLIHGVEDDYAAGNLEPTSPSLGLQAFLNNASVTALRDFDQGGVDRNFIDTFSALPSSITAATLRIGLKPQGSSLNSNDSIGLGVFNDVTGVADDFWGARIGMDGGSAVQLLPLPWTTANYPNGVVITLDLNALPLASSGTQSLLASMNAFGKLDINAQDDTAVDFVELWVDSPKPCLPGWTIVLDGVDGMGNPVHETTVTMQDDPLTPEDETGMYWFTDLKPGEYMIREVISPPWEQSSPASGKYNVTLQSGDVIEDQNFLNYVPGSIHGYKFEDLNVNGIDDGEPRLAGVTITLTGDVDGDGSIDTLTAVTDANGEYWFIELHPGNYTVKETPPPGSKPTTPDSYEVFVHSREELVAEAGQAMLTQVVDFENAMVAEGALLTNLDGLTFSGAALAKPGEPQAAFLNAGQNSFDIVIGGTVPFSGNFITDPIVNGDAGITGTIEVYFPAPVSGLHLSLADLDFGGSNVDLFTGQAFDSRNNLLETVTTTATTPVPADSVATRIDFAMPGISRVTLSVTNASVVRAGWGIDNIAFDLRYETLVGPELAFGNAFGAIGNFFEGSIHGIKFDDLNDNGRHDEATEPRVPFVEILLDIDIDHDGIVDETRSSLTDVNGEYWFKDLGPGWYTIRENVPVGSQQTTADPPMIDLLSGQVYVFESGLVDPLGTNQVEVVEPLLAFGNHWPERGEIHLCKFNDLNGNGRQDEGEPPLSGVDVNLYVQGPGGDFHLLETETTGSTGGVWFLNLRPGAYRLEEVLLDGTIITTRPVDDIELLPGQVLTLGDCTAPTDMVIDTLQGRGDDSVLLTYDIKHMLAEPFDVSFYLSTDRFLDVGDAVLDTITISTPSDLTGGRHSKELLVGPGGVLLPGAGVAEVDEDYFILAVADPNDLIDEEDSDPIHEDNISALVGTYQAGNGALYVHGSSAGDTIDIASAGTTHDVTFNGSTLSYAAGSVSEIRARLHSGDDLLDASASSVPLHVLGGSGNDTIYGGAGNDTVAGGDGDDRVVWNSRGGNDVVDGDVGADTVEVHGGDGGEELEVSANGLRLNFELTQFDAFSLDIGGVEVLDLHASGGDDTIRVNDLVGVNDPIQITSGLNLRRAIPGASPNLGTYIDIDLPQGFFGQKNGVPSDALASRMFLAGQPVDIDGDPTNLKIFGVAEHEGDNEKHPTEEDLQNPDTIIAVSGAALGGIDDTSVVPIQIEQLSLFTADTFSVTYGAEAPSSFDLFIDLSESAQLPGHIDLTRTGLHTAVGESSLPVTARLTFTNPDLNGPQAVAQPEFTEVFTAPVNVGIDRQDPGTLLTVRIDGGAGADTFIVAPNQSTAISINGGSADDASPDTVEVAAPELEVRFVPDDSGTAGTIELEGHQSVAVSGLEEFQLGALPPGADQVRIDLEVTDLAGNPIAEVRRGESFLLRAFAEDISAVPEAVFAAYLDVFYDARLVTVTGPIELGNFANGHSGDTRLDGLLDEVGGFGGLDATGANPTPVFSVRFRATTTGRMAFFADAADDSPRHDVLLFGQSEPISLDAISFGSVTIEIIPSPWQNLGNPLDANGDGTVSASDALALINELNHPIFIDENSKLPAEAPAPDAPFLDVNGDGFVTPVDVLEIINELNALPSAGEGESPLDALPLPATAAVRPSAARLSSANVSSDDVLALADGASWRTNLSGAAESRFGHGMPGEPPAREEELLQVWEDEFDELLSVLSSDSAISKQLSPI